MPNILNTSIGQPSYPLSYLDNDWSNCSTNDVDPTRYTHNLMPPPIPSSSHQNPFHDFAESRDFTSTPELEPWPEATSYPRQTNQWRKDCSLPLGYWPLFPQSEEYDDGGESQSLALLTSQDWSGRPDYLNVDTTSHVEPWHGDLDTGNAPDPQASEVDTELRALAAGALAAANNPLQSQIRLETPDIVHSAVNDLAEIVCIQCGTQFINKRAFNDHTRETQHAPYACKCGGTFSRIDVLKRHLDKFNSNVTFPCPHCARFSGLGAFSRQDHLTQHLRSYHNIEAVGGTGNRQTSRANEIFCPHEECSNHHTTESNSLFSRALPSSRPSGKFKSQKHFTRHLREVHDESPFPCQVLNCKRIDGRGFFRKRDLLKHQRQYHQNELDQ